MIASSKCRDLALALQLMVTKVSFEDVEIAVNHIIQCATNVLSVRQVYHYSLMDLFVCFEKAVNMPLQKRGTILDLDLARASRIMRNNTNRTELEFNMDNQG